MTVPHRPQSPVIVAGRMSRRALITNLGAAGLGLTIFGACGGSSGNGVSSTPIAGSAPPDPTAAPATDAEVDPPSTAPAPDPAATDPLATDAPGETDTAAEAGLRLQHVSFGFVSAFVLLRGNEAAVVDTGTGDAAAILEGLELLGSSWTDVGHVVLTHKHDDHVGGLAGVLAQASGATVYAGEADLGSIRSDATLRAIGDGDEVLGMGVLNTPGHTPGSISLFDTETGILVAGDAVTGDDDILGEPPPRFTDDTDLALASIAKLAALQPRIAAFGHTGPPITTDVTAQLVALGAG